MSRLGSIFLVLVACNLLSMLWLVVRGDEGGGPIEGYAGEHVVQPEYSLQLLQDNTFPAAGGNNTELMVYSSAANADALSQAAGESENSDGQSCYILGNFASEADAVAAMTGSPQPYRVLARQVQQEGAPRYRVRSEVQSDREAGLLRLSELRQAIARSGAAIDSYLVTSGAIANAVSLGLFGEQSNALNVQRLLRAQGEEVVVELENQLGTRFQVVLIDSYHVDINGENWASLGLELTLSTGSENLCETIAQAE